VTPLLLLALACAPAKLLRLENEVLKNQVAEMEAQLQSCEQDAPPPDFATHVTIEVVRDYMARSGYAPEAQPTPTILSLPIRGENVQFRLSAQLFEREKVLYLAISDYAEIEQAASSSAMVLLLTQLAALNYEMLLGKFQLNPNSGEISLSVELNLEDGLGFRTFRAVLQHLLRTADGKYPELMRAAQGRGL
jgi:hypothetical protein